MIILSHSLALGYLVLPIFSFLHVHNHNHNHNNHFFICYMMYILALSGVGLTNRKFQAGKQAKKLAEKMTIQREFQRQQQQLQEKQDASASAAGSGGAHGQGQAKSMSAEAVMENYREKRGGSLMEQHLAKTARLSAEKSSDDPTAGAGQRRGFDRERDLLSHSRMDQHKVAKLVENARELDSRFDKACVQKSFL